MAKTTSQNHISKQYNWFLAIAVIVLALFPLVFVRGEYSGSDAQGEKAITEVQPGYEPWFKHIFEPASSEVESFLFASQAALGAGLIGYVIGLYKGRTEQKILHQQSDQQSPE